MSEKPISPLRQRMLEDMSVRRFVPDTQREYIRAVKRLATFLGRSPDSAIPEELRAFQLHLTETGVQPPTINATVTALRFFFKVTLDRPETTRRLVFVYEPRKLPRVLSPEEVLRLLEAAPGPKHKAALSVAYGAGLRAMEVVALKVCDVDSKRMMIRVEQGKGRKDRHAMLSPQLLELLRDWWRIASPSVDVPRPRPHQPDDHAPAQSRLPYGCRVGWAAHMGCAAHAATQLRYAPARAEHRHSCDPGFARAFQARHHGALHPGGHQHHP
jgi:integrase/recombinase XerD